MRRIGSYNWLWVIREICSYSGDVTIFTVRPPLRYLFVDTPNVVEGVVVGCFPDLYTALSGNMLDQVISL